MKLQCDNHFKPIRMAVIKESEYNKHWQRYEKNGNLIHCQWECKMAHPAMEKVSHFLKSLNVKLPWWWFTHQVMSDCCNTMDCGPPGSSVHRISQARILEQVPISFSRRFSWPRLQTWVSCIVGVFFFFFRCILYRLSYKRSPVKLPWKSLSHVQLFATPWTVVCQALCPWNSSGKNTGVGCHTLL